MLYIDLCICQRHSAISTAYIPISSAGIFGVPRDVVADAAFRAVMKFNNYVGSDQQSVNLKNIRFVNIDAAMTKSNLTKFREMYEKVKNQSFSLSDGHESPEPLVEEGFSGAEFNDGAETASPILLTCDDSSERKCVETATAAGSSASADAHPNRYVSALTVEEYLWRFIQQYRMEDMINICGHETKLKYVDEHNLLELSQTQADQSAFMVSEKIAELCRELAEEIIDDTFPLPAGIDVEVFETAAREVISEFASTIFYFDKNKKCHVVGSKRSVTVIKNRHVFKNIIVEIQNSAVGNWPTTSNGPSMDYVITKDDQTKRLPEKDKATTMDVDESDLSQTKISPLVATKRRRVLKLENPEQMLQLQADTASKHEDVVKKPKLTQNGAGTSKDDKEEDCVICMDKMTQPKELTCGHKFCADCIRESFEKCQPKCPSCGKLFGVQHGNQPPGTMMVRTDHRSLPGFEGLNMIEIAYNIPDGIQSVSTLC